VARRLLRGVNCGEVKVKVPPTMAPIRSERRIGQRYRRERELAGAALSGSFADVGC
jgi:hypothetical protein